jgi:hypothetical protein
VQQQSLRVGDSGIVEQDVQPAQGLHGASHHRFDLGLHGDVTADRRTAAAQALDYRCRCPGRLRIDVGAGDIRARLRHHLAELPAQAAAGPGDQRNLAVQAE